MDSSPNKTPIEVIKEGALKVLILEIFILVLMKNGTKIYGENLFRYQILILNFMHQIIMMWMGINMV